MSIHVAKKESSSKTFRPRGSSSVTKLKCTGTGIGFIQQYVFKKVATMTITKTDRSTYSHYINSMTYHQYYYITIILFL